MKFSMKGRDNAGNTNNCAKMYQGSWWYNSCHLSNLNGRYFKAGDVSASGINWFYWRNDRRSMIRSEMKMQGFSQIGPKIWASIS